MAEPVEARALKAQAELLPYALGFFGVALPVFVWAAAFAQDAVDNKALAAKGKLTMPVLALGGDHSYKTQMADIMRLVASDVTGGVITHSGHWVMEEQPQTK